MASTFWDLFIDPSPSSRGRLEHPRAIGVPMVDFERVGEPGRAQLQIGHTTSQDRSGAPQLNSLYLR